jgi:hypothetical protein
MEPGSREADDTLNTPWMWCAYVCGYTTKCMKNPHRWTREDTEEFYDRMIQTSAIAEAAAESVLRQRVRHQLRPDLRHLNQRRESSAPPR